jgi:hypothetical protein
MTEPATIIGLSAVGAYAAKDVVTRLLGPTADYLGGEMQQFTERRLKTIGRIFRNAAEKAQDRLDGPGAVPPRVLRDIVNEGSFQDDDLAVEYFGGVLASSRTVMSRDDRSVIFTSLISRLSVYQLRTHYIAYSILRDLLLNRPKRRTDYFASSALWIRIPLMVYIEAMDFTPEERERLQSILEHTSWGLKKEGLVRNLGYGPEIQLIPDLSDTIFFSPAVAGVELFLRVHGIDFSTAGDFLSPELNLSTKYPVRILPGSKIERG